MKMKFKVSENRYFFLSCIFAVYKQRNIEEESEREERYCVHYNSKIKQKKESIFYVNEFWGYIFAGVCERQTQIDYGQLTLTLLLYISKIETIRDCVDCLFSVDFTTHIVANHGTRIRSHNKYKYIHHIPICIANVVLLLPAIDSIHIYTYIK